MTYHKLSKMESVSFILASGLVLVLIGYNLGLMYQKANIEAAMQSFTDSCEAMGVGTTRPDWVGCPTNDLMFR